MTVQALDRQIRELLGQVHVMSLATVGPDGAPHAASLFFAAGGLSLVWTSDAAARHSAHVERSARVAATLAADTADFRTVLGLQVVGTARRLAAGRDADRAAELMRSRYPFLAQAASAPASLRSAIDRAGYYQLDPQRITLIDNAKGFGHKDTLCLQADGRWALGG